MDNCRESDLGPLGHFGRPEKSIAVVVLVVGDVVAPAVVTVVSLVVVDVPVYASCAATHLSVLRLPRDRAIKA